jgi:hypothetical protein
LKICSVQECIVAAGSDFVMNPDTNWSVTSIVRQHWLASLDCQNMGSVHISGIMRAFCPRNAVKPRLRARGFQADSFTIPLTLPPCESLKNCHAGVFTRRCDSSGGAHRIFRAHRRLKVWLHLR